MDLQLKDHRFLVTGASSGFGRAIAERLLEEEAHIVAVARRTEKLEELKRINSEHTEIIAGDLMEQAARDAILDAVSNETLHGVVFNAGGPPPGSAVETEMAAWDDAYRLVMRWKIELAGRLLPLFQQRGYGRMLFIESGSIKQPVPDLVLSNAFRAGIAGFAKTLSQEVAPKGITVNILAPGAHDSPAIKRVINTKAQKGNISYEEAKWQLEHAIPVQRMGRPEEMAALAAWLLSPHAGYVTGQTITHDGGKNVSLFG